MDLGKVIAHIPARAGSKRVPSKNLRYLCDKPLVAYAIEKSLACPLLPDVFLNTDSDALAALAENMQCRVYRRSEHLGADDASGEDFTADFIKAFNPDTLVMISPVCPLIETSDITAALNAYAESDADTLISCSETHMQTLCQGKAINIDTNGPLAPSQNNPAITICNWAITIWNAAIFMNLYNLNGSGYFGTNRQFFPIDPLKAIKISDEHDFRMAESILLSKKQSSSTTADCPRYWNEHSCDEEL